MTYYHASTVGSNLKRLVENHIVVYATPERAIEAFGGDCEVYDENYVADGKCRCEEGTEWYSLTEMSMIYLIRSRSMIVELLDCVKRISIRRG